MYYDKGQSSSGNQKQQLSYNKQESILNAQKSYQKYLTNIYETIRQKQFYIHRSETPTIHKINYNDLSKLSKLSQISEANPKSTNRDQRPKSLPKIQSKDAINEQLIGSIVEKGKDQAKLTIQANLSQKQTYSASSKKNSPSSKYNRNSNKNIYSFGNFPQSKPTPGLRESKQISKNPSSKKQQLSIETKQAKSLANQRQLSKNIATISPNQNKQQRVTLYRKISKDNMNLLGLNVQKIKYCDKKQILNTNRRFMFLRMNSPTLIEQCIEAKFNQQSFFPYCESNEEQENSVIVFKQKNENKFFQLKNCEDFISQTIQANKNIIKQIHAQKRIQKNHSPSREKRGASVGEKKKFIQFENQQELNPIYETRYKKYLDLIFKLSYSYLKYAEMDPEIHPASHQSIKNDKKYKAWIGTGNNGNLIKALIKRRFWWQIVEQKSWNVNFIWTQLKNNQYFKAQTQKLKFSKSFFQNKNNKQLESNSTKNDDSLCLSAEEKNFDRNKTSLVKTRAQSSLPGGFPTKFKDKVPSTTKKNRGPSEEQIKSIERFFNTQEIENYKKNYCKMEKKTFSQKLQLLEIQKFNPLQCRVHNHLVNNFYLGNKKALFHNLKQYYSLTGGDLFKTVPLTFHIKKGIKDPQYKRFLAYYKKRQIYIKKQEKDMQMGIQEKRKMRNIWIVKPGENSNRGNGITVIDQVYELNSIFKSQGKHHDGTQKTFIVQLYIDRPLLYKKRKFDIRHYMLITHIHGVMKGYWFEEGYIRTAGYEFDVQDFQREIHLTNDAVQKYTANYGKFQPANKISYAEFQKYLDQTFPKKNYSFFDTILPRMKQICLDAIKSACLKISPEKLQHNFELFGMDFMIDSDFVPWLIEINTNPCLQLTCALQSRLLPQVVDETLRLTLDVIYPPPCHYPNTSRHLVPECSNMKAQLIFDERIDGKQVRKLYERKRINEKALLQQIGQLEDDEVYEDEGQQDFKLEEILQ